VELEPLELEPLERAPATRFAPVVDRRLRVPEPLPVKLVAVADVRLLSAAGLERKLDAFYVGLFRFERAPDESDRHAADATISYRAENFTLHLAVQEPPVRRSDLRALGVEVPSLAALEEKLIEAEQEYERQRGLLPGERSIVLIDPAGNWVQAVETKPV
jgi:hypothetical protein